MRERKKIIILTVLIVLGIILLIYMGVYANLNMQFPYVSPGDSGYSRLLVDEENREIYLDGKLLESRFFRYSWQGGTLYATGRDNGYLIIKRSYGYETQTSKQASKLASKDRKYFGQKYKFYYVSAKDILEEGKAGVYDAAGSEAYDAAYINKLYEDSSFMMLRGDYALYFEYGEHPIYGGLATAAGEWYILPMNGWEQEVGLECVEDSSRAVVKGVKRYDYNDGYIAAKGAHGYYIIDAAKEMFVYSGQDEAEFLREYRKYFGAGGEKAELPYSVPNKTE